MPSASEQTALKVSVITPTYNRAEYLREALASVFWQTLLPWEVIVIDDGSTDHTIQVIQDMSESVRLFQQAHQGIVAARNLGLNNSTGDLIAWLDSDDLWEPNYLSTVVSILMKNPAVGGVYTGFTVIDAEGTELKMSTRTEPPEQLYEALTHGCFILTSSFIARKSCYDQVGGFDPQFLTSEDADMFLRLSKRFHIVGVPESLVRYRVHATNTMSDMSAFRESRLRFAHKQSGEALNGENELSDAGRAAYGAAFLAIALKYMQTGDSTEGWSFMTKSVEIHPNILGELETFYELVCGDQPLGIRGDAKRLDIGRAAVQIRSWLDELFEKENPNLAELRRTAYGNAYLALGMLSDQADRWRDARRYLFRALKESPGLALESGVLRRLLKVTLLSPRIMAAVRDHR